MGCGEREGQRHRWWLGGCCCGSRHIINAEDAPFAWHSHYGDHGKRAGATVTDPLQLSPTQHSHTHPEMGPPHRHDTAWVLFRARFGSFGCSVNLPLGSRSADPHSTAVGVEACSTPVLNRAQRGCDVWPLFTRWSTRYCNQDLRRATLEEGERGQPRPARRSPEPFLHGDALLPACVTTTSPHHSAGGSSEGMSALAWAPSIFGAARFGR